MLPFVGWSLYTIFMRTYTHSMTISLYNYKMILIHLDLEVIMKRKMEEEAAAEAAGLDSFDSNEEVEEEEEEQLDVWIFL